MPAPSSISRLSTELVVSRTVRDTAAVLDATHCATDADLYHLPLPARPYVDELAAEPPTLRVGLLTDGGEYEIDPECVTAAEDAAALLESMGHDVEPVKGDVLFSASGKVNGRLWMAGIARRVAAVGDMLGRTLTADEVEPYNWTAAERGAPVTASQWTADQETQQEWVVEVLDWFAPYDLLVSPTSGCPPMRTDDLWPDDETPWKMGRTYGRIGRFTLPFNATGQPAVSLPLHWTPDGLPVGVQFVAGMGREDLLIRLAARLEEARPWADRRPERFA
jgi:amidase